MQKIYAQLDDVGDNMERYAKLAQQQQDVYRTTCGESPLQPEYARVALRTAAEAGKLTDRQYAILTERVVPLCTAGATPRPDGEGGVRIGGARIAYIYSQGEVEALQPRCARPGTSLLAVL